MATIADLTVAMGADAREFTHALQTGVNQVRTFTADVNRLGANVQILDPTRSTAGIRTAREELAALGLTVTRTAEGVERIKLSAPFVAAVQAMRATKTGLAQLNRDIEDTTRNLAFGVKGTDFGDPKQAAAIRDAVAAQQQWLTAVGATKAQHEQLLVVQRQIGVEQFKIANAQRDPGAGLAAIQSRIALLREGATLDSTRALSLAKLQGVESALTIAVSRGNLTLREQVELASQLAIVQRALAASTNTVAAAQTNVAKSASAFALLNTQTGRFTQLGSRAGNAALAVSFGLSELANGGKDANAAMHGILRAVAGLGLAFGPSGALVSAAAFSADAILTLFSRTRKEIEETRRTFDREIGGLINSADFLGLQRAAQKILQGTPAAGVGKTGAFKDSLIEARQSVLDLEKTLDSLPAVPKTFAELATKIGLTKSLSEIEARRKELQAEYDKVLNVLRNPLPLPKELIGLPAVKTLSPDILSSEEAMRAFAEATDDAIALLTVLVGLSDDLGVSVAATELEKRHRSITATINDQAKLGKVNRDLLEQQTALAAALGKNLQVPELKIEPIKFEEFPTAGLEGLAKAAEEAQVQVELLRVIHGEMSGDVILAELDQIAAFEATRRAAERLVEAFKDQPEVLKAVLLIMQQMEDPLEHVRGDVSATTRDWLRFARNTSLALRGALQIADAMGDVDDQTRRAIDGVLSLTDAITSMIDEAGKFKLDFSGILSAAGALASLASSILSGGGPDPETARIQENNTKALRDLADALDAHALSVSRQAEVQRGLAALLATPRADQDLLENPFLTTGIVTQQLNAFLADFGISLTDLQRIAESVEIELDLSGDGIFRSFQELADAIGLNISAITSFRRSLDDVRSAVELQRDIFNLPDDAETRLLADLQLLQQFAPALQQEFLGILDEFGNLTVPADEARAIVRQGLQDLFEAIRLNNLELADFGDLLGIDDLTSIMQALDDSLDELDEASLDAAEGLKEMTESLLGVPPGFKVAAIRFNAQLAELLPQMPPSQVQLPPSHLPPDFGKPGGVPQGGLPVLPPFNQGTRGGDIIISGPVTIVSNDPEDMFDQIEKVAQRKALATFGSTSFPFARRL